MQVLDQVIIADRESPYFARMGVIYGIEEYQPGEEFLPTRYWVEITGPRPVEKLWFLRQDLIPYSLEAHKGLMLLSKDETLIRQAMSM